MEQKILDLLHEAKTIAVVGISAKPERAGHYVPAYAQQCGYRIIPINPTLEEVLGEKAWPSLTAYGKPVDIVNVFRRPEAVPPIAEEAAAIGAGALWLQEGITSPAARSTAEKAEMTYIEDKCLKVALMMLGGKP